MIVIKKRRIIIFTSIVLLLILIVVGVFIIKHNSEHEKLNEENLQICIEKSNKVVESIKSMLESANISKDINFNKADYEENAIYKINYSYTTDSDDINLLEFKYNESCKFKEITISVISVAETGITKKSQEKFNGIATGILFSRDIEILEAERTEILNTLYNGNFTKREKNTVESTRTINDHKYTHIMKSNTGDSDNLWNLEFKIEY